MCSADQWGRKSKPFTLHEDHVKETQLKDKNCEINVQ